MTKHILIAALSMTLTIDTLSQIYFEKGYFVDSSNEKVECLIKNIDWKNNPTEFKFRISQNATVQNASIEGIREFGIYGVCKYVRALVLIDRSSDEVNKLTYERNPVLETEQLFLKVLIEGDASLFLYENANLTRFFYSLKDSAIDQLVYRRYLSDDRIAHNNYFRQQLFNELSCQSILSKDVEGLRYNRNDLEQLFIKYNECVSSEFIKYEPVRRERSIKLSFRPGLTYSELAISNPLTDLWDTDFGSKFGARLGIEAEFVLPFNKNKWGVIVEPTYQYFQSERTRESTDILGLIIVSKIDYQSIELPIGIRYYLFINDLSKMFLNFSFIVDFSGNSSIEYTRPDGFALNSLEVRSGINFGLGLGYKYKDKYSVSIRAQTSRDILRDYVFWSSSYRAFSIICGYRLF